MDDFFDRYPQGYWKVNDKKFVSKYQALLYANENNNAVVDYCYFDSVWQNFDRSQLGKFSLQELYKKRALQLREKYDYLLLYFSGGADSYNVLRSFIDNGIKLDEVCVKWCNATNTAHTQIYKPSGATLGAVNYLSEWDLAIKPVLEWLGQYHPEIKIEIVDWFENKSLIGNDAIFNKVNHWHDIEVPSLAVWSPSEQRLVEKGTTVGSIYGVDKPCTYFDSGEAYMYFPDAGIAMGTPNDVNIFGTEYFYWAPDFPILAFEMANQIINEFKIDKQLALTALTLKNRNDKKFQIMAWQIQQKKFRHILYDNWTDRFQALKPITPDRSDKHWWIFKHPELTNFRDSYIDTMSLHQTQLKGSMYLGYSADNAIPTQYKAIPTKRHFVSKWQDILQNTTD